MVTAFLAYSALACQVNPAKQALLDSIAAYQKMKSFSMTIEHSDSSGLFPGHFVQELVWAKGGVFELKVTKKSDFKESEGAHGMLAPDYFSDGKTVTVVGGGRETRTESVVPRENTSPGWEVSGGLPMSFLQDTALVKLLTNPPKEFTGTFSFGSTTKWKGESVKDVQLEMAVGAAKQVAHIYLSDDKEVVGMETDFGGKQHVAQYTKRKKDFVVPAKLGTVSGG